MPRPGAGDELQDLSIRNPENRTDLSNARRFVRLHGDKARYVHSWRKWLVWCGSHWAIDGDGSAVALAKSVSDSIWTEATQIDSDEARNFAARTAQERSIRALLSLAESELPIGPAELDQNDWLLNCPNGTVDLRTGKLREHRREDHLTRATRAEFDAASDAPTWERFLGSVFAGDADLIGFLRRFLGYALTGDVREHAIAVFHGDGANGKSTLTEAFLHAVGPGYATKAAPGLLILRHADAHPTERADLFGKRFVATSETEDGRALNESLVKELTGGDTVKARRMREDFWEFKPTWKLALATNYLPRISGSDEGIWRRVRIVPFNQTFLGDRQDKSLLDKLRGEAPGILAWAARGCLEWQNRGLGAATAVEEATRRYRQDQDVVGQFISDRCVMGATAKVRAKELRDAFEQWAADAGQPVLSRKRLIAEITKRGAVPYRNNGPCYSGIGLT